MALILNIDTAGETAMVSLAENGTLLGQKESTVQKDHASFLQPAILELLKDTGLVLEQLDAVAVSAGPGSYTGLRVGMSSAKGLCFALRKPLIVTGTLDIIAAAARSSAEEMLPGNALFCPMIDARRMEVFTAVYNYELATVEAPCTLILEQGSFAEWLIDHTLYFAGNGSTKWAGICMHKNARFISSPDTMAAMAALSYKQFTNDSFLPVESAVPVYIKDFHTGRI